MSNSGMLLPLSGSGAFSVMLCLVIEECPLISAIWSRCCSARSPGRLEGRGALGRLVERVDAEECGAGEGTGLEMTG